MAPGETIKTDACTNCTCEELATGPESHCMVEACESRREDKDYVMQETASPDVCCSTFTRSACKVGDFVYEVRLRDQKIISQTYTIHEYDENMREIM